MLVYEVTLLLKTTQEEAMTEWKEKWGIQEIRSSYFSSAVVMPHVLSQILTIITKQCNRRI